ncbi:MAG: 50S ribosomal protein L10 [Microthrixaceae bacterium]
MEDPRPDKVAVVAEVLERFQRSEAVVLAEYRGLTVSELGALRAAIRAGGGEFKVYKNTLARLAARAFGVDLDDLLVGPTALAFVSTTADGGGGDIASVAKALRDFAKGQPLLVIKGGLLGDTVLDEAAAKALASLPTADEVYARLAGAVNGNARGLAGSISGVHRSIAYVLQAAIDAGAFAGTTPVSEPAEAPEVVASEPAEVPEAAATESE